MRLLEFVTHISLGDDRGQHDIQRYGALHLMLNVKMEQSELLMVSTTGAPPVTVTRLLNRSFPREME